MKIISHPDTKTLEIDGKRFVLAKIKRRRIGKVLHDGDAIFEEVDEHKFLEKKEYIISKLVGSVHPEAIVEEILSTMPVSEIDKIYSILKKKRTKVQVQRGCLGIFVDGGNRKDRAYIPIMD